MTILVYRAELKSNTFSSMILLHRGFNEAVNGFMDDGWSMMDGDGIDDVTLLVNSSPSKMMGVNQFYNNEFPSVGTAMLCARASMLLQVGEQKLFDC